MTENENTFIVVVIVGSFVVSITCSICFTLYHRLTVPRGRLTGSFVIAISVIVRASIEITIPESNIKI